jgi:hypothetical protein
MLVRRGTIVFLGSTSTLEKPKGVVVGVALVVALAAVCIPLGREEKVLVLFELLCEESGVLPDLLFMKNYFHFKKKKKKKVFKL